MAMREIKFRAWYVYQNRMVTDCRMGEMDEENDGWGHFMQYTGLKDKNGVDIYEFMEIDNTYEVSFDNGRYILTNISNGDIISLYEYVKGSHGQVEITKEYTKI